MLNKMPKGSANATASAPRNSHRKRLLSGRARNSALASGTDDGFSAPLLSLRTARTLPSDARRENRPGTQLRAPRVQPKKGLFVVLIIFLIIGLTPIFLQRKAEAPSQNIRQVTTVLGGQKFYFEVADETAEQTNGLSNRDRLLPNTGMLFVFDEPGEQCLWMKDMKFDLDIIWLDEDKKIVKIKENVSPETYPDTFCSEKPAKYVIEVNSGVVAEAGLALGKTLHF